MTAPSDAHLEERGDQFVIIPEEKGTTLKTEVTNQDILQALLTGRTPIDLEADGCYEEPTIYQDNIGYIEKSVSHQ